MVQTKKTDKFLGKATEKDLESYLYWLSVKWGLNFIFVSGLALYLFILTNFIVAVLLLVVMVFRFLVGQRIKFLISCYD